jgi:hypothetical protein
VFNLLREEDGEIRADKLIDPNPIAGEAVLVAWHGSPGGIAYVEDLAAIAQETLRRRGEKSTLEPAVFGKQLKLVGFATERDAKGQKAAPNRGRPRSCATACARFRCPRG